MKWWGVLLAVVVFVPVSVQAKDDRELNVDIDIEGQATDWPTKGEGWEYPYFSILGVEPQENLQDVSLHIEFSTVTSERQPRKLDSFHAGRCEVFLVSPEAITPQIFPQQQGEDLTLWMPYLDKNTAVAVVIGWNDDPQKRIFWSASLRIQSPEGLKSRLWKIVSYSLKTVRVT
jgi:hypothetical protein